MGGSTSHRRRHGRRRPACKGSYASRTRPIPLPAARTEELTYSHLAITRGVGYELLLKSGWQPGSPLGASPPSSSSEPLPIRVRHGRAGLGAVEDAELGSRGFGKNMLRGGMEEGRSSSSSEDLFFDPMRPRCRFDDKHVVRNLRMLRKHELTCPSNPARASRMSGLMAGLSLVGEEGEDEGSGQGYESDEDEEEEEDMSEVSSCECGSEEDEEVENCRRGLGF